MTKKIVDAAVNLEKFLAENVGHTDEWPVKLIGDEQSAPQLAQLLTALKRAIRDRDLARPAATRSTFGDERETIQEVELDRHVLWLESKAILDALVKLFNAVADYENDASAIDKAMPETHQLLNFMRETGTVPEVWRDELLREHIETMWNMVERREMLKLDGSQGAAGAGGSGT